MTTISDITFDQQRPTKPIRHIAAIQHPVVVDQIVRGHVVVRNAIASRNTHHAEMGNRSYHRCDDRLEGWAVRKAATAERSHR
jgi:hypothetical protein